jgi:hypothetical protein
MVLVNECNEGMQCRRRSTMATAVGVVEQVMNAMIVMS